MTYQPITLAVLEEWGLYAADSKCDPENLPKLAPTVATARQLIKRAPKENRKLFKDLPALAYRLKKRGIKKQTIAIFHPGRALKSPKWHLFTFTPTN